MQQFSQEYHSVLECYKDQRNKVARLKKKISRTEGFKEYKKIVDMAKYSREKIRRLEARSKRLISRIEQIEPSGWKEFVKVMEQNFEYIMFADISKTLFLIVIFGIGACDSLTLDVHLNNVIFTFGMLLLQSTVYIMYFSILLNP